MDSDDDDVRGFTSLPTWGPPDNLSSQAHGFNRGAPYHSVRHHMPHLNHMSRLPPYAPTQVQDIHHFPPYRPTVSMHTPQPNFLLTTGWSPPNVFRAAPRIEQETRRFTDWGPRVEHQQRPQLVWPQRTPYDFRSLEYPDEVSAQLICPICRCPFINPLSLPCEHIFCDECLDQAHRGSPTCPTCRQRFDRSDVVKAPRVVASLVEDLVAKCPNHERGCTSMVTRQGVVNHRAESCDYEMVPCPKEYCDQECERRQLEGPCIHRLSECEFCHALVAENRKEDHFRNDCPSATQNCGNCLAVVPYADFEDHEQFCEPATVTCVATTFGCSFTSSSRHLMDDHERDCPLAKLAPFLQGQQQQIDSTQERYEHLYSRMQTFSSRLTSLHDNLENALVQLEDWRESIEAVGDTTMSCDAAIVNLTESQSAIRAEMGHLRESTSHWEASFRSNQSEKELLAAEVTYLHRSVQQLLTARRRTLPRISMNKSHLPLTGNMAFNDSNSESSSAAPATIEADSALPLTASPHPPIQTMRATL